MDQQPSGETDFEFQETQEMLNNTVNAWGLFIYSTENLHILPGSQLYEKPHHDNIEILLKYLEGWIK